MDPVTKGRRKPLYPGDPGFPFPWLLAGTCFLGSVRNKPSKTFLIFFNGLRVGAVAGILLHRDQWMLIRDKSSLKKYGAFLIGGKVDGIFTGTVSLVAPHVLLCQTAWPVQGGPDPRGR